MSQLPPGQKESNEFHRFGLTHFASRFPKEPSRQFIRICGMVENAIEIDEPLSGLNRTAQTSDFHCVTTWSVSGLRWEGIRFCDFYEQVLIPKTKPNDAAIFVSLKAQDGARTGMYLEDLLDPSVLIVDKLNGENLTIEHGAPLRLIAPKHYGYKSIKCLSEIKFHLPEDGYRVSGLRFMDHPRARVAQEERGRIVPGIILRYLYRPLIMRTAKLFRDAAQNRNNG